MKNMEVCEDCGYSCKYTEDDFENGEDYTYCGVLRAEIEGDSFEN